MIRKRKAQTETGRQVRARGEGSHNKPKWTRLAAVATVICCASATGIVNYTKAGAMLAAKLPTYNVMFQKEQAFLSETPATFVKRWHTTFKETGAVEDNPRAGRPHKIPDKKALQAAQILAQGYNVTYTVRRREVEELKYFSTINEAVHASDTLRAMLVEFNATPEQLLEAKNPPRGP